MTEKVSRYDATDYLRTEEDVFLYFDACIEDDLGDGSLIRAALGNIAGTRNDAPNLSNL